MERSEITGHPSRVLLFGATGTIGQATAKALVDAGHTVTCAVRNNSDQALPSFAGSTLRSGDITDPNALRRDIFGGERFDCIVSCLASRTGAPKDAWAIDHGAHVAILRTAEEHGVKRFVLISTVSAYGLPPTDHVTEDTPLDPSQADAYGRTKALGEQATVAACEEAGMDWVIVRPAMVYGPRSGTWTIGMLRNVQKRVPVVIGGGTGFAFPIYIDNLVDLLVRCLVDEAAVGQAFNACDTSVTWKDFFGFYSRMSDIPLRGMPLWLAKVLVVANRYLPLGLPLDDHRLAYVQRKVVFDSTSAREQLGWTPAVTLEEGMARSEAWLREEGRL